MRLGHSELACDLTKNTHDSLLILIWAVSSYTPIILKILKLALTFYLKKGTVVELV